LQLKLFDAHGESNAELDMIASSGFQAQLLDLAAQIPSIPSTPHMPVQGIARVEQLMAQSKCYLEYGTGGTTMTANRLGVAQIIAVESDWLWMQSLRAALAEEANPGSSTHLLHIDIGPTGDWGFPRTDTGWKQYRDYSLTPWEYCREHQLAPDLVLIDGRFRSACFLVSCLMAAPGTRILFDDYGDRPYYHFVERFLKPVAHHDRVAEFVVHDQLAPEPMWLALTQAVSDPR